MTSESPSCCFRECFVPLGRIVRALDSFRLNRFKCLERLHAISERRASRSFVLW